MNALSSVFVACTLLVAGIEKPREAILGKWEASNEQVKGTTVEFAKDGGVKVTIQTGDQPLTVEGKYKFTADDTVEIEIKVEDQVVKSKNKVEFKDKDHLILTDEKNVKQELQRR